MTTEKPQIAPDGKILSLGSAIDKMLEIRDKRTELSKQDKELKEEFDNLEAIVLQQLREQDTVQGRSKRATATVSEQLIATIEDWESFETYVKENDAFYLLAKRPANAAYKELLQQGVDVPGLKPFTKLSISLRRL